ncbi:MAG TPA: hypothetical protein PLL05_05540 [Muribaculaceae bacterium]|nr:hypothetical protein [Muribaculaceae bacterium]
MSTTFLRTTLVVSALVVSIALPQDTQACTSMIVGARASANGRPLLWKHRDTGTEHNFVDTVCRPGQFGYVALFNGGDSLRSEAWMGLNDTGFGIMNTASYNLAPDTAKLVDREGIVMSMALGRCRTVADFATLLDTLPRPMGVQANFGVIDAYGNGAYFETNDNGYTAYYLKNTESDVLIRTNFSFSGNDTTGYGYVRYDNLCHLAEERIRHHTLTPAFFTEDASRSFYHSRLGRDILCDSTRWAIDQDFIPRRISSASIVIEGVAPGQDPKDAVMWTVIGYPPCSHVRAVSIDSVPPELQPSAPGWRSPACNEVIKAKYKAFPLRRPGDKSYIDMDYLRSKMHIERIMSINEYDKHTKK